jgi:chromosome partition protein MukE
VSKTFEQLQDVIEDAEFPALDLALRRGFHVDRDAAGWYTLLSEAQALLEGFYRRYGCELIHKTDGYYYLLPTSDQLPRRQLSAQDMLVGQALALLYLDPISLERGGLVTREQVIEQLVAALGTPALMAAFVPKRKRKDEQAAQRQVRAKIAESIRRLAALGFAEQLAEEQLRLRPALLRFAEPVRGLAEPAAALARLVAQGEVAVVTDEPEADASGANDGADESDDASAMHEVVDELEADPPAMHEVADELEADAPAMHQVVDELEADAEAARDGIDEPEADAAAVHDGMDEPEAHASAAHDDIDEPEADTASTVYGTDKPEADAEATHDDVDELEAAAAATHDGIDEPHIDAHAIRADRSALDADRRDADGGEGPP